MGEMENRLLETLKEYPVVDELLAEFTLVHLENACSAWSLCEPEIEELTDYSDNSLDLWKNCAFSKEKWFSLLNFIPPGGFLYKLVKANLIYPDGDYNKEWLTERKLEETLKGGKKWKSKE